MAVQIDVGTFSERLKKLYDSWQVRCRQHWRADWIDMLHHAAQQFKTTILKSCSGMMVLRCGCVGKFACESCG